MMTEEALQRDHDLRAVCNSWCWLVRVGIHGRTSRKICHVETRVTPGQPQLKAEVCATLLRTLRVLQHLAEGHCV